MFYFVNSFQVIFPLLPCFELSGEVISVQYSHFKPFDKLWFLVFSESYKLVTLARQKQPLEVLYDKKGVLKNFAKFTGKHLRQSLEASACKFIKKETLAQVFSCEFCKIFENSFLQ